MVIAIIGVLIGLLLFPAVQRCAAAPAQCTNNLKESASLFFHSANVFPPVSANGKAPFGTSASQVKGSSW